MLFAWISDASDLTEVITIFNKTVLLCNQKIDPGIFSHKSKIIFFIKSNNNLQEFAKIIFGHKMFQQSPNVAIGMEDKEGAISFFSFDFFQTQIDISKQVILTYVWSKSNPLLSLNSIYTDRNDFKGLRIRVGAIPVSHCVVAEPIPTDDRSWSNITQFQGHYGFEIEILRACSRVLNFTYKLFNPAVFDYFSVTEDNSYSGLLGDVYSGSFDVSMGASLGTFETRQLLDDSISFDQEAFHMASPNPQLLPKVFVMIHPFDSTVWIFLPITFVIVAVMFMVTSLAEERSKKIVLREFNTISYSFQFCLRTILTETVPKIDSATELSYPMR